MKKTWRGFSSPWEINVYTFERLLSTRKQLQITHTGMFVLKEQPDSPLLDRHIGYMGDFAEQWLIN